MKRTKNELTISPAQPVTAIATIAGKAANGSNENKIGNKMGEKCSQNSYRTANNRQLLKSKHKNSQSQPANKTYLHRSSSLSLSLPTPPLSLSLFDRHILQFFSSFTVLCVLFGVFSVFKFVVMLRLYFTSFVSIWPQLIMKVSLIMCLDYERRC